MIAWKMVLSVGLSLLLLSLRLLRRLPHPTSETTREAQEMDIQLQGCQEHLQELLQMNKIISILRMKLLRYYTLS